MNTDTSSWPALRGLGGRLPSVRFGPYSLLETAPWLLLATAARMHARHSELGRPLLPLFLMLVAQLALFLAFLIASNRMIERSGGKTELEQLSFKQQLVLGRGILRRLLSLFFAANCIAVILGMDKFVAAGFWLGFDGIVYDWRHDMLLFWSPLVATIAFLMIVEKGIGREPKFGPVLRQLLGRRWHLLVAMVAIVALQGTSNVIQGYAGALVQPVYDQLTMPIVKNLMYLAFLFSVSCARLYLTVAILTYSLRMSYRQSS